MTERKQGLLEINASILLISFNGLFAKLINLPAVSITFWRCLPAILALGIALLFIRKRLIRPNRKEVFISILTGLLLALHWVSYFYAIQMSTVAIGILTLYTYPVMSVFLEGLFFRESPPRILDYLMALLVLMGVLFIVPDLSPGNKYLPGIISGLVSALAISFRNILSKKYLKRQNSLSIMFYQISISALVLLPSLYFFRKTPEPMELGYLLVLGALTTAGGHTLFVNGLMKLPVKTASIISGFQPVYAVFFAAIFLGEIPSSRIYLGGALILLAVFVETVAGNDLKTALRRLLGHKQVVQDRSRPENPQNPSDSE